MAPQSKIYGGKPLNNPLYLGLSDATFIKNYINFYHAIILPPTSSSKHKNLFNNAIFN